MVNIIINYILRVLGAFPRHIRLRPLTTKTFMHLHIRLACVAVVSFPRAREAREGMEREKYTRIIYTIPILFCSFSRSMPSCASLACVASVPVRTKSFFCDRRAFSAFWPRENWGESKKVGGGGEGGGGMRELG